MKVSTKNSVGFSPFNCIAMKDIKDKETGKGDFRPLFDCVGSMSECVKKLQDFMNSASDPSQSASIDRHIKSLIGIQKELLKICEGEIDKQGNAGVESQDPLGEQTGPVEPEQAEAEPVQQQVSSEAPVFTSKLKVK